MTDEGLGIALRVPIVIGAGTVVVGIVVSTLGTVSTRRARARGESAPQAGLRLRVTGWVLQVAGALALLGTVLLWGGLD